MRGYTIVEVLAVLAIIALLASIMVPRYAEKREQTYVATMRSDLRNLASAQETYYRVDGAYGYASDKNDLTFTESAGVTVMILEASATGWSARATHASTSWSCAVYIGDAAGVEPATQSGVLNCAKS